MQLNAIYLGMPHLRLPQKLLLTMNSALGRIKETDKRKWIMRINLTTFLLIIALAQVYAKGFGQKITLNESNEPLEKVLKSIRQQSGYEFIYDVNDLKGQKISINLSNASVEDAVKESIRDLPLAFKIVQKNIVLTRIEPSFLERIVDRFNAIDVRGVVVDSAGNPLQGATVKVKGSNTQVNTNARGEFYIANVDENAVLVVSYVGYVSREVKAEKDLGMIRMVMASADLEEVAVVSTGYQEIPKERATGSFVLIDNKMLNQQTGTNILKRLEGITSGLAFDTKSNELGRRKLNLTIRGVSTINGPIDPLVVLDGFIYEGKIENINPNDIENITVLKDAAAASIWGARAGNGVIVITSKRGKFNQKTQVDFNSTVIISKKPDLFKLPQISSSDYIDVEETLFNNGYFDDLITYTPYAALTPAVEVFLKRRNTEISSTDSSNQINYLKGLDVRNDYSKYFYRNALTQQYNVGLRGGSNINTYTFSVGYDKNISELYDQFNKLNIKIDNVFKPIKKLQINLGVYFTNSKNSSGRTSYNTVFIGGRRVPYLQFADEAGNPMSLSIDYRKSYVDEIGHGKLLDWQYTPLKDHKHSTMSKNLQEWFATTGLQYKILNSLTVDLKYQHQREVSDDEQLNDVNSYYARNAINTFTQIDPVTKVPKYIVPVGGIRRLGNIANESETARGQLNFDEQFGQNALTAIIGSEFRQTKFVTTNNINYGYSDNPLSFSNVDLVNYYPEIVTGYVNYLSGPAQDRDLTNRFISYYANAAYSLKGRYILSASGRRDGANIFGANTNDRWKPLWSTGLVWKISKEPFYNWSALNELSLRGTYGKSGNVDLRKTALPTAGYQLDPLTNLPSASIFTINDPSLRWEQVKTFNLGIDFELKNQILLGSIEYYQKKASDLYGSVLYDYSAWGRTNLITKNIGNMQGHGVEVMLNSKNVDEIFKWQTGFIFNYATNKTTTYPNPSNNITALITVSNVGGTSITPVTGKSLYGIAAYKWGGLNANGKPQGYLNGQLSTDYVAIRKEGLDKGLNGNVVYLGSALPVYYGSINNSFSYKNFMLSVNISYKLGYYFKKQTINYVTLINSGIGHSDFAKRWKSPGDEKFTDVPVFDYQDYQNPSTFYGQSEVNVLKGDHIRLQYINLSYSAGKRLVSKLSIKDLQIYFNASNLGMLWNSNEEDIDPEYPSGFTPLKTFAFGLRGSF